MGGGTGARLCGGRGPRRPGAARPLRALCRAGFPSPPPPPPITWLSSGRGGIFFWKSAPHPTEQDLSLGSNLGGGCRARGAPPPPTAPRTPPQSPERRSPRGPPAPPEEAAAEAVRLSPQAERTGNMLRPSALQKAGIPTPINSMCEDGKDPVCQGKQIQIG
ncbi:formin-like protein 3 [Myotis myotis]|uniref:formin-like protein 3 n=1 Tax=Myotis myotis TaxID=51298 RepID=UPI00174939E9|nr:formin-like protein 3 [Myotis myotis]